ncbi:neurexin-3 [Trichonephila clavipes]|nr:neurexin-3 [Trichonephila clavipes]
MEKALFLFYLFILLFLTQTIAPLHTREWTPAEATFRGAEYLSFNLQSLNAEPVLSSSDQISLFFKSRQPNGLLLYTGKGEDHLLLTLKDGGILLVIHLGSSSVEKALKPAKVRFDDNQWHKVLVHRKVREILWLSGDPGLNPGEGIDVCLCIVPSRHGSTPNRHRAAHPLVWGKKVGCPDHLQSVLSWVAEMRQKTYCHLHGAQNHY